MMPGVVYTCGVRDDYNAANGLVSRIRILYDSRVGSIAAGDDDAAQRCAELIEDLVATATPEVLRTATILAATGLVKAESDGLEDAPAVADHSGSRSRG